MIKIRDWLKKRRLASLREKAVSVGHDFGEYSDQQIEEALGMIRALKGDGLSDEEVLFFLEHVRDELSKINKKD